MHANVCKSVTMEHGLKNEGKQETTKKEENAKLASLHLQEPKNKLLERQDIY